MIIDNLEASETVEEINKLINAQTDSSSGEANNNIILVTEEDNLVHNYFHYFETSFDCVNCLSSVYVKMPKMDEENTNYWINYTGWILIYLGNNVKNESLTLGTSSTTTVENTTLESLSNTGTQTDTINSTDRYFDTLNLVPFFKGKISRVTETANELEFYIDNIGRRFKQKIPKEFRESYIYNQNVRDAFQAICEFIGVYYVCPPKKENTDTESEEEGEESDSSTPSEYKPETNNIYYKRRKEAQAKGKARRKAQAEKEKAKSSTTSSTTSSSTTSSSSDSSSNSEDTSGEESTEEETTSDADGDVIISGYDDVEFDAGGNIVIGGVVIEDSPNIAKTLLQMNETPSIEYDEVDPSVKMDIQKLFAGQMFDELHNEVMDYGAITIDPKSSSSSEMSTVGGSTANSSDSSSSSSGSSTYWSKQGFSSQASYDAYQAKKNSSGYIYVVNTSDKGWIKVNYRRYLAAYNKGWQTKMNTSKITGKTHGSHVPTSGQVLSL